MGIFNSIETSASGLNAQRVRMDTIAENIANVNTTRTEKGGPYRRKDVAFASYLKKSMTEEGHIDQQRGVKVKKVTEDTKPPRLIHDPSHPDADENGNVAMANVDLPTEMANMISANRGYEANVTALNTSKNMFMKALEIGKR